jgi:hypothetical protein
MKTKLKLIFPAALALIFATGNALADTNPASTNAAPSADTNAPSMASLFGDPVIAKGKGFTPRAARRFRRRSCRPSKASCSTG